MTLLTSNIRLLIIIIIVNSNIEIFVFHCFLDVVILCKQKLQPNVSIYVLP